MLVSIIVWYMFKFEVKKSKCTDNIFSPTFYTHGREAEITHSECKQHKEIVDISAEGSESSKVQELK